MTTSDFNNSRNRWLTFLVYFLLSILTVMTGWQQVQVNAMRQRFNTLPKDYVLKERYLADRVNIVDQLKRIDRKLDRLIESIPSHYKAK